VHITADQQGGWCVFSVVDNGIGLKSNTPSKFSASSSACTAVTSTPQRNRLGDLPARGGTIRRTDLA